MDREWIRSRLKTANADAAACAAEIKATGGTNYSLLRSLVLRYIEIRYFLNEKELLSENLYELAETAVAKTFSIKREGLADIDIPGSCIGASSATSKKILLLLALCRDLGISMDPAEAVTLQTVDQLTHYIESILKSTDK